jgi:hypothetical protein
VVLTGCVQETDATIATVRTEVDDLRRRVAALEAIVEKAGLKKLVERIGNDDSFDPRGASLGRMR